jgi:histidyl-tRNA synthetase
VRAYIEHNLYKVAQPVKLFYIGPMFRQERQQKGRYRQHTQIGVEVLGTSDPLVDVEVISLLYAIHQAVGVREEVVYVNNLGDMETRQAYVPELRAYLQRHRDELDADSLSRMETNPLRTFDSKHEGTQAVLDEAPRISGYLSGEASAHLTAVRQGLQALGIPHEIDDRLVRGLDYYTMTVFEAKSGALGAQDTVGAGGRYNGLRPRRARARGDRLRLRPRADAVSRRFARGAHQPGRVLRDPRSRSPHTCHEARRRPAGRRNLRRPGLRRARHARAVQAGRSYGCLIRCHTR